MYCKFCGGDMASDAIVCPHCGRQVAPLRREETPIDPYEGNIPAEIQGKFNFGAFFLSWIWGIGNSTWIMLLGLIVPWPIMGIIGGIYGNEWAWKNGRWRDVEHFKKTQKNWTIWGVVIFVASIVLTIFYLLFLMTMLSEVFGTLD